ncbi:MAG: tetratricopeptide repeat protein [Desulfovibrionaceae bacterium]|nr:tetratricopeptide repeat protein [Desulfovibrionaceae bacterium]
MACENGVCALSGQVRQLRRAGVEAHQAGDTELAVTLLTRSMDLSRMGGSPEVSTAHSAYRLALVLHEASRFDEAARHFEMALGLARDRAGCGSRLYRTILGDFAQALA